MFVQDGYELKKRFLIHLLTYKENQYDSNIPEVLQDYLNATLVSQMEEHELL